MFDPQKLLGHVLKDALGSGIRKKRKKPRQRSITGLGSGMEAKIGMGVLGIAMAAFEHFRGNKQPSATATPPPAPSSATPPPPPPAAASAAPQSQNALHLLRAMIAAANADGVLDSEERDGILQRAQEAGLEADDIQSLQREMAAPLSVQQLIAQTAPNLANEVYAAVLISIDIDTDAEKNFVEQLATGLNLTADTRRAIESELGIE
jgi:uncharacterized membrane protein YebE (DUF533 family)